MKKKTKKKKKKPQAEAAEEIARVSVKATRRSDFFMAPFPTDSADHSHVACFATENLHLLVVGFKRWVQTSLDSRHQSYESSLILDTALMNMFQDMLCKSSVLVQPRPHSL